MQKMWRCGGSVIQASSITINAGTIIATGGNGGEGGDGSECNYNGGDGGAGGNGAVAIVSSEF